MKAIITSFVFFGLCCSTQAQNDSALIGKWFYCDSMKGPDELDKMLFYSDKNKTECDQVENVFYWSLKEDGSFDWNDTTQNSKNDIIDGIVVHSFNKWRLDNNLLYMGNNVFIIDILDSNHLLIHRRMDTSDDSLLGLWRFSKGVCISKKDTIIQKPNPSSDSITKYKRPYSEIRFISTDKYESGVFCFSCGGMMYPGKWSISTDSILYLSPRFEDRNYLQEFSGMHIRIRDRVFYLSDNKGCRYEFIRK